MKTFVLIQVSDRFVRKNIRSLNQLVIFLEEWEILYFGEDGEEPPVLENSQLSSARPSDKSATNVKTWEWYEVIDSDRAPGNLALLFNSEMRYLER